MDISNQIANEQLRRIRKSVDEGVLTAFEGIAAAIYDLGLLAVGCVEPDKKELIPTFSWYFDRTNKTQTTLGGDLNTKYLIATRNPAFAIVAALLGDINCPAHLRFGEHGVLEDAFYHDILLKHSITRPHYGLQYGPNHDPIIYINKKIYSLFHLPGRLSGQVYFVNNEEFDEAPRIGPGQFSSKMAHTVLGSIHVESDRDTSFMTLPQDYDSFLS